MRSICIAVGYSLNVVVVSGVGVELRRAQNEKDVARTRQWGADKILMRSEKNDARSIFSGKEALATSSYLEAGTETTKGAYEDRVSALVSYNVIGVGSYCGYHYVNAPALNLTTCAEACALQIGCSAFSFGSHDWGCRLSACELRNANHKSTLTGKTCGTTSDFSPVVTTQCSTVKGHGNLLYHMTTYSIIGAKTACGYNYLPKNSARSPMACARECRALSGCTIFSYGDVLGCRISACVDSSRHDTSQACGYHTAQTLGVPGQCGTHEYADTFLYEFPFETSSSTGTGTAFTISYSQIQSSRTCGYQYHHTSTAADVNACATECASKAGCTVFSFGSNLGCRLSACGYRSAADQSKMCGASADRQTAIFGQCGTHSYASNTLYMINNFAQIGVNMVCGYNYLHKSAATNPVLCAKQCKEKVGCTVFSFGASLGCRISACVDSSRLYQSKDCGYAGSGAIAVHGQCGTHAYDENFLYRLPRQSTFVW